MLDLLFKRRSIRRFEKRGVPPEVIEKLVKAMLLAPSSRNINPWEFIIITDQELLHQLSLAKEHGSAFLKDAPLGVVVIADGNKSDVWVEDTSIASMLLQLTAQDLGLGSCWIQIRNRMRNSEQTSEDYIKELLRIPAPYKVESVIALGYPAEKRAPHNEAELQLNKVHVNEFGQSYR